MTNKELILKAIEVKENAYAPYSNFKVGAVVLTESGNIYTGTNIENSSYPNTCCAEKNAISSAISNKEKIVKIAIFGDSPYTYPCGACRQIMVEFNPNMEVIVGEDENNYKTHTASELLPYYFSLNK